MVSKEEIIMWLGGTGNVEMNDVIELIQEIANGEYEPEQLHQDITQYGRNR